MTDEKNLEQSSELKTPPVEFEMDLGAKVLPVAHSPFANDTGSLMALFDRLWSLAAMSVEKTGHHSPMALVITYTEAILIDMTPVFQCDKGDEAIENLMRFLAQEHKPRAMGLVYEMSGTPVDAPEGTIPKSALYAQMEWHDGQTVQRRAEIGPVVEGGASRRLGLSSTVYDAPDFFGKALKERLVTLHKNIGG